MVCVMLYGGDVCTCVVCSVWCVVCGVCGMYMLCTVEVCVQGEWS